MKDELLNAFAKITGKSKDELTALITTKAEDGEGHTINDDAVDVLLNLDSVRIEAIKTGVKTKLHKKVYAETKTAVLLEAEKSIGEFLGVDYEGRKLMEIVKDGNEKASKIKDAKKTPEYLDLENRFKTFEVEKQTEFDTKLKSVIKETRAKESLLLARSVGSDYLDSLNPVISGESNHVIKQKSLFINSIIGNNVEKVDDVFIMIDENGDRLEDKHGNHITMKAYIQTHAKESYQFKVQDKKPGGGNETGPPSIPTDQAELNKMLFNENDPAKRKEMREKFKVANEK